MIRDYTELLQKVEHNILAHLNKNNVSDMIKEASIYSITAGGKRVRPLLLFKTLNALDMKPNKGIAIASAIEMIHTYSLIHDDLPAMDNDDYRRGKLTNHKVFGEATAILAGDNLLTESFNLLSNSDYESSIKIELIQKLSESAGQNGMIGGQMTDILSSNEDINLEELENIHNNKTGKMIEVSVDSACIISNANTRIRKNLIQFAKELGILFQIKDDLLDVQGNMKELGKTIGTDEKNQTTTYVSLFGLDGALKLLKEKKQHTIDILYELKEDIDIFHLEDIVSIVVNRTK